MSLTISFRSFRSFVSFAGLSLAPFALVACGGADDPSQGYSPQAAQSAQPGQAGQAGASGASGASQAGASGQAGAGQAGAGQAGSGQGGSGQAGAGGAKASGGAGSGGSAGKAGGQAGGSAGNHPGQAGASGKTQASECKTDDDCAKPASACEMSVCLAGACSVKALPAGVSAGPQTSHDCLKVECDGKGNATTVADDSDVPDDGNPCTIEACENGAPAAGEPAPLGTKCGGTGVCNGKGACGECMPGDGKCVDPSTVMACNDDGHWQAPASCPGGAAPACSGGACQPVVQLAAGEEHTCALLGNGTVRCWGRNQGGQLGTGETGASKPKPVEVLSLYQAESIAAGRDHTCAVLADHSVRCWGNNNQGQLGASGPGPVSPTALLVADGQLKAVQVAAGAEHTCALTETGRVKCWGNNNHGQLGVVGPKSVLPVEVPNLTNAVQITAGADHACALDGTGTVICWGRNDLGQVGDGSLDDKFFPMWLSKAGPFMAVAAGEHHTCAWPAQGKPLCWGDNQSAQIGSENGPVLSTPTTPAPFPAMTVERASLGDAHSCFVEHGDGTLFCQGGNTLGQLGQGATSDYSVSPLPVTMPGGATREVASGSYHTCARQQDGTVWCWGAGHEGQLGGGVFADKASPSLVVW